MGGEYCCPVVRPVFVCVCVCVCVFVCLCVWCVCLCVCLRALDYFVRPCRRGCLSVLQVQAHYVVFVCLRLVSVSVLALVCTIASSSLVL